MKCNHVIAIAAGAIIENERNYEDTLFTDRDRGGHGGKL